MRALFLHCDSIYFRPLRKALASAEEIDEELKKKGKKVEEALVAFVAVEAGDDESCVGQIVNDILDVAKQVKAKRYVIYPYVHLSSNPSSPQLALSLLSAIEEKLKEKVKEEVVRAPFGWYKEFDVKVKGHPLSELSRVIEPKAEGEEEGGKGEGKGKEKKGKVKAEATKTAGGGKEREKEKEEKYDYKKLLREISKMKLDTRLLKENDHRVLGKKLDLFSFSEVAPNMVFWHPKGLFVRNMLIDWMRQLLSEYGYYEIQTPQILDKKLWQISGHWEKYRENIFLTQYDERQFAVKPMSCPGCMLVYKQKPRTYKELPLRISEFGIVHRQELSGVVTGMFRAIQFIQDDAHIFCKEEQIEDEISKLLDLAKYVYKTLGFSYRVVLSTRPEKRIGSEKMWDLAESTLKRILDKKKVDYEIAEGEGAFYGPKIDFLIKDSLGREWQTTTIQLDFSMPERFDLTYIDADGKEKRPVMLHRAIFGSLERFIAVLLEHTRGNLPFWLSPIQCRIIPVSENYNQEAIEIANDFNQHQELRTDVDDRNLSVNKKIREAELEHIPIIIVIGKEELENEMFSVRLKGTKEIKKMKPAEFRQLVQQLQEVKLFKPLPTEQLLSKRVTFI
jgi:threonyl-tRNA synthetase